MRKGDRVLAIDDRQEEWPGTVINVLGEQYVVELDHHPRVDVVLIHHTDIRVAGDRAGARPS